MHAYRWTRPQEGNFSSPTPAQKSRTEVVEERIPPEQEELASSFDGHRGDHETSQEEPGHESEADDPGNGSQTTDETPVLEESLTPPASRPGHPMRNTPPTLKSDNDQEALDLVNGLSRAVATATVAGTNGNDGWGHRDRQPASGDCVTAATFSRGVDTDPHEREGDQLASLDARARTLLEDCRRVLASTPSAPDKVCRHVMMKGI